MCKSNVAVPNNTSSSEATQNRNTNEDKRQYHCLDVWAIPPSIYNLSNAERKEIIPTLHRHHNGPFPDSSLDKPAPISFYEEATVILMLITTMGGPLLWVWGSIAALMFGSWHMKLLVVLISSLLAYHPLPSSPSFVQNFMVSKYTQCLYKYFTYRFVWTDDALEKVQSCKPWLGAGPPHGVLPFANILSIPGINTLGCMPFVGAPASVVFNTPFLRYLTMYPTVHVDRASITKALGEGHAVGLVPDGIAGIFRQSEHAEVVALKHRKGIARLALSTGTPVLPAYSFNNTAAFSAWWDKFGFLEWLSRKTQASIFIYWGRFGLPIPRRVQITMVYGNPIMVEKVEGGKPTKEQVDELHETILEGIRDCFESHRDALGLGDKELIFE